MPAKTERQRKFMGAELARAKAGKPTKTKMSVKQLKEFASTPAPKRHGDPQIGQKRKKEARMAAIGRGLLKQM